jgi:hypothetical protein
MSLIEPGSAPHTIEQFRIGAVGWDEVEAAQYYS